MRYHLDPSQERVPGKTVRQSRRCGAWLIAALLLLPLLFGAAAKAQYSGPSLGNNTAVNPPVTITTDPAILRPGPRDFYLASQDLLAVRLYGSADYVSTARISLDGAADLPLIGSVHLAGLTLSQAQSVIAGKLIDAGMYRNPQVSIQVTESPSQTATVVGELHGIVPIIGERGLLDVLAAVGGGSGLSTSSTTVVVGGGGLPPTASHIITINRPGVDQPITVDLGTDPAKSAQSDIPVFPHDTIVVPRVGVVYLLGAFKTQGAIPLQQNSPLTLMQVAALAGGTGFEGRYNDLRLVRTVGYSRQVVKVDVKKVLDGKAPDPILQADDIVFLPSSPMKSALKSGGFSTLLGIISILIFAIQQ